MKRSKPIQYRPADSIDGVDVVTVRMSVLLTRREVERILSRRLDQSKDRDALRYELEAILIRQLELITKDRKP